MSRYRIAPSHRLDFSLAGPGNDFDDLDEACLAAESLDVSLPLDEDGSDDEWCVFERTPGGGWRNLTRADGGAR